MLNSIMQPSFAAGEISTALYGRVDLAKYHVGLKTCFNFFVHPYGGVSNRPGTQFCGPQKDETNPARLIPFSYSSSQTYMLEFGNFYMRPIYQGGYITETELAITGATQTNPVVLTIPNHGYVTGDDIFVGGVEGMTQLNGRTFQITVIDANTVSLNGVDGTGYSAFSGDVTTVTASQTAPGTSGSSSSTTVSSGSTGTGTGSSGATYYANTTPPSTTKPGASPYFGDVSLP